MRVAGPAAGSRVLILSAGVGSGHNTAATVLASELRDVPGIAAVRQLDVLDATNELYRTLMDDAYFGLVEAVPWLVGWGYDRNDPPFRLGGSISVWTRINTTSAVRQIKRFRPDVVVGTHFLPIRLVSLLITRGVLRSRLVAVTTDYDFQGLWLSSPFNHFFVARDETRAFMSAIGVPADRITTSGIPVQPKLGRSVDEAAVRKRFGVRPAVPVLLISAGAAGGAYATSIVQQTLRMQQDFQAVVVCGRNEDLRTEIEALVDARPQHYTVLGYTSEMPDLMRIATLFVGKPGGLSASECMAAGLPMVMIKPIPGQEERNADYLLEEGAAVRCNYDTTVGYKIDALLADPDRIAAMARSARRVGHADAVAVVTAAVRSERSAPLWISHAAQRSILRSAERGVAAADLSAGRRLRTLVDTTTGVSAAVITQAQLRNLSPVRDGVVRPRARWSISTDRLTELRRHRVDPGLLLTLRRMLGSSSSMTLDVD